MSQARKNARIMQRVVARKIAKANAKATMISNGIAAGKYKSWSEMSWRDVYDLFMGNVKNRFDQRLDIDENGNGTWQDAYGAT